MEPERDGLELRKLLEILFRWWWVLLIVPAITAGLAYYQAANQTPMYQAATEILVQQARSGLIGTTNPGANRGLASTYARLANTIDLSSRVQEELSLARLPNIKTSGNGPIIRISVEDPDPVVARDVANKLAEVLILDVQTSQLLQIGRLEALAASQGIEVSREVLGAQLSTFDSLRIIEKASTPASSFWPRPMRSGLTGAFIGLVLGGLMVFLLEYLNKKIRSPEQLEEVVGISNPGISTIGVILRWKRKEAKSNELVVLNDPGSSYAESFRQLRTSLQSVRVVHDTKAFMITSAAPQEGKSTVVSNLAVVLAQGGSRVILVDGDLRRPSLHSIFDLPKAYVRNHYHGLSGLLIDKQRPACEELQDVGIPGLKVVTSGQVPPNPTDLLASDRARAVFDELKKQCEILLVDSVPAMAAADAAVLAGYVDGVILTVAMGESRSDAVRDAALQIQRTGTPIIGYVMNKLKSRRLGYGHNYYYYSQDIKTSHTNGARPGHKANATGSVLSRALDRVKNPLGH